jgi:hypothetical protein
LEKLWRTNKYQRWCFVAKEIELKDPLENMQMVKEVASKPNDLAGRNNNCNCFSTPIVEGLKTHAGANQWI